MGNDNGGDRRSVFTDALETLGMTLDETARRDAIHLAVEPVIAGERLPPGTHITVENGIAKAALVGAGIGIVDPFLICAVNKGDRFWFVMYPRQVRSLRHVWTHPAFPPPIEIAGKADPENKEEASVKWVRDYARQLNVGYADLIESATSYLDYGDYMVRGGVLEGFSTADEFWDHYEVITGRKVLGGQRNNFFSCSC